MEDIEFEIPRSHRQCLEWPRRARESFIEFEAVRGYLWGGKKSAFYSGWVPKPVGEYRKVRYNMIYDTVVIRGRVPLVLHVSFKTPRNSWKFAEYYALAIYRNRRLKLIDE